MCCLPVTLAADAWTLARAGNCGTAKLQPLSLVVKWLFVFCYVRFGTHGLPQALFVGGFDTELDQAGAPLVRL